MRRRNASLISQASTTSTIEDNLSSVEDIADNIFAEATQSYQQSRNEEEPVAEEERIIRDMDQDLPSHSSSHSDESNVIRRRRPVSLDEERPRSTAETEKSSETVVVGEGEKISIKLKFLNDEIKIDTNAFLHETISSFKR